MTAPDRLPEPSDAQLISAWADGDESAAAELVRRHGRAVVAYLAASGAGDDAEDVAQEAFFRAFRKIHTFSGRAGFRTWVIAIAGNALKDLRRKHRRRMVLPLEDRDAPDVSSDPHGDVVADETEARLAEAVRGLPYMQREVFLLRAQQEASYEEIAEVLETTIGAARVHYHHAVKRLKAALEA